MTDEGKYLSPLVSCLECREVRSAKGLFQHFIYAHNKESSNYKNCLQKESRKKSFETLAKTNLAKITKKIEEYLKSPNFCPECNSILEYKIRRNKFCSHKCAAITGNRKRLESGVPFHTESSKSKISKKLKGKSVSRSPRKTQTEQEICGPFTRIYLCTCKYTGTKWYSKTTKTVYPNLVRSKAEYSYSCLFKFGISNFPLWFKDASELINEHGWYSTPGSKKSGIRNIDGIQRDHLYSVSDGYRNGVHPSVLRHPANCELKRHKENQSKGKNSSITLEELFQRIADFNLVYPEYAEHVIKDLNPYY